jgi:drug/metabolite transporter (DMT)-like permease
MMPIPKWLAYSTVSMLIWAIWSLLSPIASRDLQGATVQILSSAGLIPFALLLLFSKNLKKGTHKARGFLMALATGVMGGLGNIMLYNALGSNGPVSLIFPIISLAPVVPVALAPVLFGERIRGHQAFGVCVAVVAIVLLNTASGSSPTGAAFHFSTGWMWYTLGALGFFGITFLTQKGATYFISDELSTVAFAVGFVLLDVCVVWWDRSLRWNVSARSGWLSVAIGILMGAGAFTLFAAYRHGKASLVTPFSQLYPILTVLAAVPLYHERIDILRGAGVVAALGAGIVLSIEKPESAHRSAGET